MSKLCRIAGLLILATLAACAGYGGSGLRIGEADVEAVMQVMGPPAMEWQDADGSRQFAYPRGPAGVHTYMVRIDANGKLQGIENVLAPAHFARIRKGMGPQEVLRLLGPIDPYNGTSYFAARDELVWEWLYCDDWNQLARFYVLFDGTAQTVRSTMSLIDNQCGGWGDRPCRCSR